MKRKRGNIDASRDATDPQYLYAGSVNKGIHIDFLPLVYESFANHLNDKALHYKNVLVHASIEASSGNNRFCNCRFHLSNNFISINFFRFLKRF